MPATGWFRVIPPTPSAWPAATTESSQTSRAATISHAGAAPVLYADPAFELAFAFGIRIRPRSDEASGQSFALNFDPHEAGRHPRPDRRLAASYLRGEFYGALHGRAGFLSICSIAAGGRQNGVR